MAPKDSTPLQPSPAEELRLLKDKKYYLQRKLQTFQEKHEAAQSWFLDNRRQVVNIYQDLHQRLTQSIEKGDLNSFLGFVEGLNKSAHLGAALNIPYTEDTRFYDYIAAQGKTCEGYEQTLRYLESVPLGLPQDLFQEVDTGANEDISHAQKTHEEEAEQKPGWWKRVTDQDQREIKAEIAEVKADILDIENSRSFQKAVITSFFDWAEAATAQPDSHKKDGEFDIDHLQNQHEDADFILRHAQQDWNEALTAFAEELAPLARHSVALHAFLAAPDSYQPEDLNSLVQDSFFKENAAAAFQLKNAYGPDALTAHLGNKMKKTTLFFDYLDLLLKHTDASPASKKPNKFFDKMLEAILQQETNEAQYALQITISAMEKAQKPIAPALENVKALQRIAKSSLADDVKEKLQLQLLKTVEPPKTPSSHAMSMIYMTDFFNKITYGKEGAADVFSPPNMSSIRKIEPEHYAYLRIVAPELNLYQSCFENTQDDKMYRFFNILMLSGVPFDMGDQSYQASDILLKLYQKTVEDSIWAIELPDFYGLMAHQDQDPALTTDTIKRILILPVDGGPDRYIDKMIKTGNASLISDALEFLKTPVEKANFLYDMAENARTDELKSTYLNMSKVLDTPLMEYREGEVLAAGKAAFITTRNNQIICQMDDHTQTLPGHFKEYEMQEIFYGLLRYGFADIGGQLINPANISFAEVTGTDEDPALMIYPNTIYAQLGMEGESADSALEKLMAANSDLVRIGDHVINPEKIDHVYFEGDVVNFICGTTCLLSVQCEDSAKSEIQEFLGQSRHFTEVNDHFINIDRAEALVYFEDTEQLIILNGEATYAAEEKLKHFNEAYLRADMPDINCNPAEARALLKQLKSRDYVIEDTTAIRPSAVCEICKTDENGETALSLLLSKQNRSFDYLTEGQQAKLAGKIEKAGNFVTLGNTKVGLDHIRKLDLWTSDDAQMIVGQTLYSLAEADLSERASLQHKLQRKQNFHQNERTLFDTDALDAASIHKSDKALSLSYGSISSKSQIDDSNKLLHSIRHSQQDLASQMDGKTHTLGHELSNKKFRMSYKKDDWTRVAEKTEKLTQKPEKILFGADYETRPPQEFLPNFDNSVYKSDAGQEWTNVYNSAAGDINKSFNNAKGTPPETSEPAKKQDRKPPRRGGGSTGYYPEI